MVTSTWWSAKKTDALSFDADEILSDDSEGRVDVAQPQTHQIEHDGNGRLEADHPRRRTGEIELLLVLRVGGMVGGDRVDELRLLVHLEEQLLHVEQVDGVVARAGQAAEIAARRHRADEYAGIGAVTLHAHAVAEDSSAGHRARRINRDHADGCPALTKLAHECAHQS